MPPQYVGRSFGRYRVVEAIGAGGMGEVYRARDEQLNRDVAVKCLSSTTPDASRGRMRREAYALSKLNHPNIATVHDFGHEDGVDYVVMELIRGRSLADRLEDGPIPIAEAVAIAGQVAAGLEDAHAHGVVHRDLKPGNVMLTERGQVKVVDFGVAWHAPDLGDQTMTSAQAGPISGTLPYMAPEQIRGDQPDARADVWSLGVLLFELVTGRRPFDPPNALLIAERILNSEPPSARALNPDVPVWLDALIARALEKPVDRRIQTMGDMRALLRGPAEAPRGAAPRPAPARTGPPRRRHRVVAVALVLVAAIAAGIVAGRRFFTGGGQVEPPRTALLVADTVNRTGDAAFDETVVELLSTSLEQSQSLAIYPRTRVSHVLELMRRDATAPIDVETGREILQREGLGALVTSTVSRLGDSFVLLVTVEDAAGSRLASSRQVFEQAGELPSRIDAAVREVREGLGESTGSIQANAVPLAEVTSGSLDAVRLYTRGRQRLYAGDPEGAMALFRSALELDPDFAMAHEYIGVAYTNVQDLARAEQHVARAVELADRVPAAERHKILGDFHMLRRNYSDACTQFELLVELRPLDPTPLMSLGWCKGLRFDYTGAVADTRRALSMQPTVRAKVNLARLIFLGGSPADAATQLREVLAEQPDNMQARFVAGQADLALRRLDAAAGSYRALVAAGGSWELEGHLGLADIALARGHLDEAAEHLEATERIAGRLGNARTRGRASVILAEIAAARDGRGAAVPRLASLEGTRDPVLQWLVARTLGAAPAVRSPAIQPAGAAETARPDRSLGAMLAAEIALSRGDTDTAVRQADLAWELERSVNARETQARAYAAAGRAADAAACYEEVLARTPERIDALDKPGFHRVIDVEYRLGVLLDDMGEKARARAAFERFLAVRTAADGPREADARRRLAATR